jgi:hypothetical protein
MFILYFSKLHFIFYKFLKFIPIFWNITKNKKKSKTPPHSVGPASTHGSGTVGLAGSATRCGRSHRIHDHCGGAARTSSPVAPGR